MAATQFSKNEKHSGMITLQADHRILAASKRGWQIFVCEDTKIICFIVFSIDRKGVQLDRKPYLYGVAKRMPRSISIVSFWFCYDYHLCALFVVNAGYQHFLQEEKFCYGYHHPVFFVFVQLAQLSNFSQKRG